MVTGAKILIIGTHCDDEKCGVDEIDEKNRLQEEKIRMLQAKLRDHKEQYDKIQESRCQENSSSFVKHEGPNIITADVFTTSDTITTDENKNVRYATNELESKIFEIINCVDGVDGGYPLGILKTPIKKIWMRVYDQIEELRKRKCHCISVFELKRLDGMDDISDKQVLDAVEFFSKTGEIIHFRETGIHEENFEKCQLVFPKPHRLMKILKGVLNHNPSVNQKRIENLKRTTSFGSKEKILDDVQFNIIIGITSEKFIEEKWSERVHNEQVQRTVENAVFSWADIVVDIQTAADPEVLGDSILELTRKLFEYYGIIIPIIDPSPEVYYNLFPIYFYFNF